MKWMTSGANRLKANLNRSFGARRNKKSALIKNYESIVVAPFERKTKPTRNKNRTKRHISTNITTNAAAPNAPLPPPEVAVDKEEDNNTSKRKIIRNGSKQNRMIGVSSALPQRGDMPFNNMLTSNQQDNTNMPMTHRQQNDALFNTDSIERFVTQQESQSAKKRQHQMEEIVIRERAIQREMKEVALMKQQHMNLDSNQQQQQQPMMMNGSGGLDFNAHNSYQNTQKSSTFNFDLDMMNNSNVGNGSGLDVLRNVESGGGNGLSRFRMQPSDTNLDDEASTRQANQQEDEPNGNSTQLGGEVMPLNDSQSVQLKPPPIRYFNNGVEVNMQGSPLSSITSHSKSDFLNKNTSATGGGMHGVHTQQPGMEEEKMPSRKKQPPIQQPSGMPKPPQHMMMPQPQLMKQNTNYQMPNNQMTTTGTAGAVLTTKEPLNSKKKQSTLPEPPAKLPPREDDDMSKAERKAKKKAAKKEKRKRSSTQQQNRSSKAPWVEPCHPEVERKDESNKLDSTKSVKKTVNTNDAADQMPTKDEPPRVTDKGCTSEQSLSAKADQKMPKSTDDNCNTTNRSSSAASSSNVNANFIPKLSTHVSRGPHGDVLDQLFGGL